MRKKERKKEKKDRQGLTGKQARKKEIKILIYEKKREKEEIKNKREIETEAETKKRNNLY